MEAIKTWVQEHPVLAVLGALALYFGWQHTHPDKQVEDDNRYDVVATAEADVCRDVPLLGVIDPWQGTRSQLYAEADRLYGRLDSAASLQSELEADYDIPDAEFDPDVSELRGGLDLIMSSWDQAVERYYDDFSEEETVNPELIDDDMVHYQVREVIAWCNSGGTDLIDTHIDYEFYEVPEYDIPSPGDDYEQPDREFPL